MYPCARLTHSVGQVQALTDSSGHPLSLPNPFGNAPLAGCFDYTLQVPKSAQTETYPLCHVPSLLSQPSGSASQLALTTLKGQCIQLARLNTGITFVFLSAANYLLSYTCSPHGGQAQPPNFPVSGLQS